MSPANVADIAEQANVMSRLRRRSRAWRTTVDGVTVAHEVAGRPSRSRGPAEPRPARARPQVRLPAGRPRGDQRRRAASEQVHCRTTVSQNVRDDFIRRSTRPAHAQLARAGRAGVFDCFRRRRGKGGCAQRDLDRQYRRCATTPRAQCGRRGQTSGPFQRVEAARCFRHTGRLLSQVGDDLEMTKQILAAWCATPTQGGV